MKWTSRLAIVAVLFSLGEADAGPVLLATASGEQTLPLPSFVDSVTTTSYLRYQREAGVGFDLFDDEPVLVRRDDPPWTVYDSVGSSLDDPDFDVYAEFLTDGVYELLFFFSPELGAINGGFEEEFLQVHVAPFSHVDLVGYRIDRIDQCVTYDVTDIGLHVDGRFEFYGSVIPCPPTLLLLAVGSFTLVRRVRPTKH